MPTSCLLKQTTLDQTQCNILHYKISLKGLQRFAVFLVHCYLTFCAVPLPPFLKNVTSFMDAPFFHDPKIIPISLQKHFVIYSEVSVWCYILHRGVIFHFRTLQINEWIFVENVEQNHMESNSLVMNAFLLILLIECTQLWNFLHCML